MVKHDHDYCESVIGYTDADIKIGIGEASRPRPPTRGSDCNGENRRICSGACRCRDVMWPGIEHGCEAHPEEQRLVTLQGECSRASRCAETGRLATHLRRPSFWDTTGHQNRDGCLRGNKSRCDGLAKALPVPRTHCMRFDN
jgi:hypothetical protein